MKDFIVEFCEDTNKNNKKYKITYWELFDTYFNLYIENIVDEIEYQVEILISDLENKDKQERYLIINDTISDYLYSCGD